MSEHELLKGRAGELLEENGYEVSFEQFVGRRIVDVLGVKNGKKVAVECGGAPKDRLAFLAIHCDQVYHMPKTGQKPSTITMKEIEKIWYRDMTSIVGLLASDTKDYVRGIQKFFSTPQKVVVELYPDGKSIFGVESLEEE